MELEKLWCGLSWEFGRLCYNELSPFLEAEVFPELSPEELKRYSRHLLIPEVGYEGQQRLKAASVLIVGSGGLGSPIALYLAAAGVGRLGIVDYDVVDVSNLQRQVLHSTATIGENKVVSARKSLLQINPTIEVNAINEVFCSENAERIAAGYDVLVDGTDNFPTRYLLNDLAVITGRPYVYGSIFRFEGQASVFDARKGPCYRCLFPEPPPPGLTPSCAEGGVFGVLPGIIGCIQATEVIKTLLGIGESLTGKLLLFDALEMSFQTIQLRKNPNCKVCGKEAEIKYLIDYDQFCGVQARESLRCADEWDMSPVVLDELLQKGEKIQLVDVRSAVEKQISDLPGSVLMPVEQIHDRMDELNKNEIVVLFCRTGIRSRRALEILRAAGFANVYSLLGGINGWARDVDGSVRIY